jgi:hypothetical protein
MIGGELSVKNILKKFDVIYGLPFIKTNKNHITEMIQNTLLKKANDLINSFSN